MNVIPLHFHFPQKLEKEKKDNPLLFYLLCRKCCDIICREKKGWEGNMEENKMLVTELPLPFDEKDLEELKSANCIIDYRGDGKLVVKDGQLTLSYDNHWWENNKEK